MKLQIQSIDLENEVIWLKALEDCNLKNYLVFDTTYTDDTHVSNEHRHAYWFPPKEVKKGDWVKLFSHSGSISSFKNQSGTTTYVYYWKLGNNVWNNNGDAAILFELNTWHTVRARP